MPRNDLPIPSLQLEDPLQPCHQIVALSSNLALRVPTDCTPSSSPCFPLPPTMMNVSDPNHLRTHANLASSPQTSSTTPDKTPSGSRASTDHLSSMTRRLTDLSLSSAGARPTHPKSFQFDDNEDPQQVLVFIDIDVHQLIIDSPVL